MPSGLDVVHANDLLTASIYCTALPASTAPIKLRLMDSSVVPTASLAGTEVVKGASSYPTGGAPLTAGTVLPNSTSGGTVTNSVGAVNFPNMPGVTVAAIELWDSSATAKRKWFGTITSKTTNPGDTLSFAQNNVTATLA